MSMGGDIMEEHYDKLIQDFLTKLKKMHMIPDDPREKLMIWNVIEKYKEHFKNNGIYDS